MTDVRGFGSLKPPGGGAPRQRSLKTRVIAGVVAFVVVMFGMVATAEFAGAAPAYQITLTTNGLSRDCKTGVTTGSLTFSGYQQLPQDGGGLYTGLLFLDSETDPNANSYASAIANNGVVTFTGISTTVDPKSSTFDVSVDTPTGDRRCHSVEATRRLLILGVAGGAEGVDVR